jgi:hypothetical protein
MNKTDLRNFFRPIIILFILISAVCLSFGNWLDGKGIDHIVLMYGNLILFLLTLVACVIHIRALKNNNPYAFVRAVTLASFLKLIVIAINVVIYFTVVKTRSIYAIAIAMAFYIVYTIFEVKGAMRLNRERNAKN